jgi:hypothetical protein
MAIVSLNNLAGGLVKDTNSELLPSDPMVWTEANNVRFKDGSVSKMTGSEVALATPINPTYVSITDDGQKQQIIVCGDTKIYSYYSGTWNDITNADYDYSTSTNNWQHTVLNAFPVFNNGTNRPQAWSNLQPTEKLKDLEGWDLSSTCSIMRSFKAYLLAGNIIENGISYPSRVKWSGSALPNELPTTWDVEDVTNDAGYIDLADSVGSIIDMRVLGDNLLIYKQRSVYLMMYIGGNNIFSVKQVFNSIGALAKDCIAEINGQHLVLTTDDVILTDGNSFKSIIDGKLRKHLFSSINNQALNAAYVTQYYKFSEVWVCVPVGSSKTANRAYVYNYATGIWSTRNLNNLPQITQIPLDISTAASFNSSNTPFNSSDYIYNLSQYQLNQYFLVGCDTANSRLVLLETNATTDVGVNIIATVERTNLQTGDDESIKIVKRIFPKMTKVAGSSNVVNFYIGTQMKRNEPIVWTNAMPFNIVTDEKIDLFATGKFLSLRIESTGDINWTLENLDFELSSGGKW